MHRINTPSADPDANGLGKPGFTDGDPETATPATVIDAVFLNAIQEEVCSFIESQGISLDDEASDQLKSAIDAHKSAAYAEDVKIQSMFPGVRFKTTSPAGAFARVGTQSHFLHLSADSNGDDAVDGYGNYTDFRNIVVVNLDTGKIVINGDDSNLDQGVQFYVRSESYFPLTGYVINAANPYRASFLCQRSSEILGAASGVVAGMNIGGISCGADRGNGVVSNGMDGGAEVLAFATQNWSATANGTELHFCTTQNDTTGSEARFKISHDGHFLPSSDNSKDVGSSSYRLRALYSVDAVVKKLRAESETGTQADLYYHDSTPSNQGTVRLNRSCGSASSPSLVTNNTILGGFDFRGYAGTNTYDTGAQIIGVTTQDWTSSLSAHGTKIIFRTRNAGDWTLYDRFTLDDSGNMLPGQNITYDIGSSSLAYNSIYAESGLFQKLQTVAYSSYDLYQRNGLNNVIANCNFTVSSSTSSGVVQSLGTKHFNVVSVINNSNNWEFILTFDVAPSQDCAVQIHINGNSAHDPYCAFYAFTTSTSMTIECINMTNSSKERPTTGSTISVTLIGAPA